MSAPWSDEQIEELRTAIASGVLSVHYSGPPARTVMYQSLSEMRDLLAQMTSENGADAGTRRRYRRAATRKGLE